MWQKCHTLCCDFTFDASSKMSVSSCLAIDANSGRVLCARLYDLAAISRASTIMVVSRSVKNGFGSVFGILSAIVVSCLCRQVVAAGWRLH